MSESLPPKFSLPRYADPTPETHRDISREEEAEQSLTSTTFASGTKIVLIALFAVTIALVPLLQFALGTSPLGALRKIHPVAAELKTAERSIEEQSVVSRWLLPRVQLALSFLHAGNEQVYPARDGWLNYRADSDYVTGAPFALDPPLTAIVDFHDQLAARGIELVVMPLPVKPTIETNGFPNNSAFAEFEEELRRANVRVFDATKLLEERKRELTGAPLYLRTDTHWRPETMEFVAQRLAQFVDPKLADNSPVKRASETMTAPGDIEQMLKLPASQKIYAPETVAIHPDENWRPNESAKTLLLGDSFSNIYSLAPMGWGESAGFAEQLSYSLGQPLDCILRNSDGAFATREILQRELAHGRDRFAGKKVVIWEFAARELAFGNWKKLPMKLAPPHAARFFVLPPNESIVVTGEVEAVSAVPRPGTVPYRDHILAVHLVDLAPGDSEAVVYLWSMRDNEWTEAARLRPGDRLTLRLRAWNDVSGELEKFNRSELNDPALQLEEPDWGEIVR